MPRIRYLKPSFFKDEDIKDLTATTRLFYAGLWCQADKEGRLEERQERLKVEITPYHNFDVDKALKVLSEPKRVGKKPYIIRYNINGNDYIQILEWHKHQRPHHTEPDSTIPIAPEDVLKRIGNGSLTVNNLSATAGDGKGKGKGKGEHHQQDEWFEELWKKYPRKLGKKEAKKHFIATVNTKEDLGNINKALTNYSNTKNVKEHNEEFIQHGSTWFNNWQDWVNYSGTGKPTKEEWEKQKQDRIKKAKADE